MAAVTARGEHPGPIPPGELCDDCHVNPATHRTLAASDSFGSEYADLCDSCAQRERQRREEERARGGNCDWCGKHSTDLRTTRDYDEGSAGPTYEVCKACYDRQQAALQRELARYGDECYDY
jgi:protein-arginine kinase activator protein McsA